VTVTMVPPMDHAGFFSFGTANDYTSTVARCCKRLIVEVNKNHARFRRFPAAYLRGGCRVENTSPLIEFKWPAARPEDDAIGRLVAGLVPDGRPCSFGFGGLPT